MLTSIAPLSGRVLDPLSQGIPTQVKTIILAANTPLILSNGLLGKFQEQSKIVSLYTTTMHTI